MGTRKQVMQSEFFAKTMEETVLKSTINKKYGMNGFTHTILLNYRFLLYLF